MNDLREFLPNSVLHTSLETAPGWDPVALAAKGGTGELPEDGYWLSIGIHPGQNRGAVEVSRFVLRQGSEGDAHPGMEHTRARRWDKEQPGVVAGYKVHVAGSFAVAVDTIGSSLPANLRSPLFYDGAVRMSRPDTYPLLSSDRQLLVSRGAGALASPMTVATELVSGAAVSRAGEAYSVAHHVVADRWDLLPIIETIFTTAGVSENNRERLLNHAAGKSYELAVALHLPV